MARGKSKGASGEIRGQELDGATGSDSALDTFDGNDDDGKKDSKEPKGRVKPITIQPLKILEGEITIIGMSPLLVNNFDAKSQQELDDMYQAGLNAKERKKAREDKTRERKTPHEEFEASLYPFPGKPRCYAIPAAGIKKCAVTAASLSNVPMTVAMKAFHVIGDTDGLLEVKGSAPVMDERIVRVGPFGAKKPCTRRRGRFDRWQVSFKVRYRADLITAEQLINLYESAGFSVGLCEYRPEKSGNLGMFCVKRG